MSIIYIVQIALNAAFTFLLARMIYYIERPSAMSPNRTAIAKSSRTSVPLSPVHQFRCESKNFVAIRTADSEEMIWTYNYAERTQSTQLLETSPAIQTSSLESLYDENFVDQSTQMTTAIDSSFTDLVDNLAVTLVG
ncbi:hypothetical protein M3Y94_00408600 [Aphelenchoides besseyi]|nr:hypothetical protein M3Y94_00408600 [Aphelenchoides besseyi]KAI6229663.1 hypothetical protein M3Y95_00554600 [Aphelenchoides besseyi]